MKNASSIKLKQPRLSRADFNRRADEFLKKIQKELMPEHAREFLAINMATGEYALGKSRGETMTEYRNRWPNILAFLCRVDGSPSLKYHGK